MENNAQKVSDLIYKDAHYWSTRPCPTCRDITELLGVDFGCVRYAKDEITRKQKESKNG